MLVCGNALRNRIAAYRPAGPPPTQTIRLIPAGSPVPRLVRVGGLSYICSYFRCQLLSCPVNQEKFVAERSFAKDIQSLRIGAGEEFRGEGILAVTKALLQAGVAYVGGYQGAPISHLMDVLADAEDVLDELGVHFEASASEATAAAMLAASINYPLRGAVTWKSTVGTNVASDALSNLASSGVRGGALIILGEDYGEGASIMQERTHAFAMKSQMWLLDPRPHLPEIVRSVQLGFELSEASNTPVMLMLRIRACHVYGRFTP